MNGDQCPVCGRMPRIPCQHTLAEALAELVRQRNEFIVISRNF